ncbi:hypothetical protein [Deinococcus radiophilus]|uniref:Uncharacterized protein n=1 Tax=Deinococcus radiophilus TaxID=32062 RepID=A0A3S0L2A3_9DEIO|nr:hypothetical protein [Deinococcus radiophilus]RTR25308.1 hypothetical protein EJ104_11425 [Deinococcus radiophilus]UFA52042.1 hypothetical protein LMT64_14045 [Deinococcus radiophilus]
MQVTHLKVNVLQLVHVSQHPHAAHVPGGGSFQADVCRGEVRGLGIGRVAEQVVYVGQLGSGTQAAQVIKLQQGQTLLWSVEGKE